MGRLLFKKLVTVAQLNTEATAAAGRYDAAYRTIRRADTTGDGKGDAGALENEIKFLAQMEAGDDEDQRMTVSGDVPETDAQFSTYLDVMQRAGHVTVARPYGVKKGDRLVAVHNRKGTRLIRAYPDNIHCVLAQPIDSRKQDMLLFRFVARPQGAI
jgi:hypothetical protein